MKECKGDQNAINNARDGMRDRVRPTIEELETLLKQDGPPVEITPAGEVVAAGLRENLEHALNSVCAENASNTPDFILAEYLVSCLAAFDRAVQQRERWYGRMPITGHLGVIGQQAAPPSTSTAEPT